MELMQLIENELESMRSAPRKPATTQPSEPAASVITSKAANSYHFKTGQRDWPSRTENVLPCRLLWWQVGFGAPASRAALEHVAVVE